MSMPEHKDERSHPSISPEVEAFLARSSNMQAFVNRHPTIISVLESFYAAKKTDGPVGAYDSTIYQLFKEKDFQGDKFESLRQKRAFKLIVLDDEISQLGENPDEVTIDKLNRRRVKADLLLVDYARTQNPHSKFSSTLDRMNRRIRPA